jgi:XTP/dITP diphosphohydrolase
MFRGGKRRIVYITGSKEKIQENRVFSKVCRLADNSKVGDKFTFEFVPKSVLQVLECDIEEMVRAGVRKAYSELRVPCVVEYAGLIFERYKDRSYPGGLTKAMWNALGSQFVAETNSAGQRAIARAAVAYCDGKRIHSFVGDTEGTIAPKPRGTRQFYWDTIFIPDDPTGAASNKTYSEVVDDRSLGLKYKMKHLSQSSRAMIELLNFLSANSTGGLWK